MTIEKTLREIGKNKLVAMYRNLVAARLFDEQQRQLVLSGTYIMYHSGQGQEAVGVGVIANLRKDDYVFPTHRGVTEYIAKGAKLNLLMAEVTGRKSAPMRVGLNLRMRRAMVNL